MAYTLEWTPTSSTPTASAQIRIKTWDGRPVSGASVGIDNGRVIITVPKANRYNVKYQNFGVREEANLDIPAPNNTRSMSDRISNLVEQALAEQGAGTDTDDIKSWREDPDKPGFIIFE